MGCASTNKKECSELDWFELGRRDGASGYQDDQLKNKISICADEQREHISSLYHHGRGAGLTEFCNAENAFELGLSGATYRHVCPLETQELFLSNYKRGQEVLTLEKSNLIIDRKIRQLKQRLELTSLQDLVHAELKTKLGKLKKDAEGNRSEIAKLSGKSTDPLNNDPNFENPSFDLDMFLNPKLMIPH